MSLTAIPCHFSSRYMVEDGLEQLLIVARDSPHWSRFDWTALIPDSKSSLEYHLVRGPCKFTRSEPKTNLHFCLNFI